METRRAGKKPKRYINGRFLPIFFLICLVCMLTCLFLPIIAGSQNISGLQIVGGLFDNPYNPLSIFGSKGAFYKEFIQSVDLDISDMYAENIYRFVAALVLPLIIIALAVAFILCIVKTIKELKDKRIRASLQYRFLLIFMFCLGIMGLLPGLGLEKMESIEAFINYFVKYFLFLQSYQFGVGLIVIAATSIFLTFLPLIVRLFIFAFTKRDVMLE